MALIVEDGSRPAGANSYISIADFETYALTRGITVNGDPEELLIRAMDFLEGLSYIGEKYTIAQTLQWPRWDVVIDNFYVNANTVPIQVPNGQCEAALAIDNNNDQLSDLPRNTLSAKVGSLSVTYQANQATTIVRKVHNALYKVLKGGINGISFAVGRS